MSQDNNYGNGIHPVILAILLLAAIALGIYGGLQ